MSYDDQEIARSLIGPCTTAVLSALRCAVWYARGQDEQLNSLHILYGLSHHGGEESGASTLLLRLRHDIETLRRAILDTQSSSPPFVNELGPTKHSSEIATILASTEAPNPACRS